MEQRNSNKTIMSSVFFLDIVEYSKESVVGQISLKERFNRFLSEALKNVPDADRIILDTGDGAAVSFIGDIEEALTAALALRDNILTQDMTVEPQLRIRMGINLGPVRLVRDINGQPNIVGDGINVAQRIMAFADINQILLSRSYFDAVSRLSPQYAGMFRFKGSHTDKHVREHEVYAIRLPGEETVQTPLSAPLPEDTPVAEVPPPVAQKKSKRGIWIALVLLAIAAAAGLTLRDPAPPEPAPPVVSSVAALPVIESAVPSAVVSAKPLTNKNKKTAVSAVPVVSEVVVVEGDGYITISCAEGSQVFVDSKPKGKVGSVPLSLTVPSGRHEVIVNSPTGLLNQSVTVEAGKTVRISSGSCN